MKATAALLLLVTGHTYGWPGFGNKVVRMCRKGRTSAIRSADCDALGSGGMQDCLKVPNHDHTLAVLIRRCPMTLPAGSGEFETAAERLYINRLPRSFSALLSQGRCARLGPEKMQSLLRSIVDNNSGDFLRAVVRHCVLSSDLYQQFMKQAQIQGRSDLMVVMQSTPRSPNTLAAMGPSYSTGPMVINSSMAQNQAGSTQITRQVKRLADGRQIVIEKHIVMGGRSSASAPNSSFQGDPKYAPISEVTNNINILAILHPRQARFFGLLSDACMGLTEAHFKQPNVSPRVVASLPLSCFVKIPPAAFAGLTASMVARIRWWPFVSRDQIRYITPGDPIRALPFDQLGPGRQKDREDRIHPCWTITRDQLRSIRQSSRAKREYNRRCVRSAAPTSKNLNWMLLGGLLIVMGLYY